MKINVSIPDSKSGDWSIDSFEITEKDSEFENMRSLFSSGPSTNYEPGKYKRLSRNGHVIMSNTPDEIRGHLGFIRFAKGDVLINGLGLGVCLKAILEKPEVKSVTVIEKSKDVIKMVAPYFKDKRVTIINADALKWKAPKGKRYDCVWHDIWDDICTDNLESMSTLHRKYGKRCNWQDSWKRDYLKYRKEIEKKEEIRWGRW
jgi:hypothetical protein